MDQKVDEAVEAVTLMCTPDHMTKEDAVDFLEDVIARLEGSLERLREEIEKVEKG